MRWLLAAVVALQTPSFSAAIEGKLDPVHGADVAFAQYADCLSGNPDVMRHAEKALRLFPGTPKWNESFKIFQNRKCVQQLSRVGEDVDIRFPSTMMAGALYGAMYRRQFSDMPTLDLASAPPVDVVSEFDDAPTGLYNGRPEMMMDWRVHQRLFADCLVRAQPAAARQATLARPWSDAENEAVPTLIEAMRRCMPNDESVRLNRAYLRGIVAEAVYKLSFAASTMHAGSNLAGSN